MFINRGHRLECYNSTGPDVETSFKNSNIWVEAIVVEKGEGQNKVPEVKHGVATDVPEEVSFHQSNIPNELANRKNVLPLMEGSLQRGKGFRIRQLVIRSC